MELYFDMKGKKLWTDLREDLRLTFRRFISRSISSIKDDLLSSQIEDEPNEQLKEVCREIDELLKKCEASTSLPSTILSTPITVSPEQKGQNSRKQQNSISNIREGKRASSNTASTNTPETSNPSPEVEEIKQLQKNFENFSASLDDESKIVKSKIT
jgi:hypothetical protein